MNRPCEAGENNKKKMKKFLSPRLEYGGAARTAAGGGPQKVVVPKG